MLPGLLLISLATLAVAIAALLRRPPAAIDGNRDLLELANSLGAQLTRMEAVTDARLSAVDQRLRDDLSAHRRDAADAAQQHRESSERAAQTLREEILRIVTHLGDTIRNGLNDFRTHSTEGLTAHRSDSAAAADRLNTAVKQDLEAIHQRLSGFVAESHRSEGEAREALHSRLSQLSEAQAAHQDRLRAAVEERLQQINASNTDKLEEMRLTVDEKLNATLQSRLTESFGQVTTHLGEVQKGLGEMKHLATGVGDLKRVLSNVKARGVVGEFQLGMQLEQMFSPEQYIKNARIKSGTLESVEYALKIPNGDSEVTLLPIDAKFPKEDWERLEHAQEHGTPEEIAVAGRNFERAIRAEGKRICEKYIDPPLTQPHAIMFLPTEGLYAEVVRRPGLIAELQSQCRVTVAGPSTFMAILTSFQMGLHTLAIEKKGKEVWKVLAQAKNEFEKFGGLMDKVERQVGTVQKTLSEIGGKSRTINRALKSVSSHEIASHGQVLSFDDVAGIAPLLAAAGEDDVDSPASVRQ